MPYFKKIIARIRSVKHIELYVLIAVVIGFFLPYIIKGQVLLLRYLFYLYYPDWLYYRECLSHFKIPLWTPYTGCGEPFLANSDTAVLYPFNLIFLIFPVGIGLIIFLIIHFLIGGIGIYGMCRLWSVSPRGSLLAAVSFIFSASMISKIEFTSALSSLSWTPVVIALYTIWLKKKRLWLILVLGVALSLQYYAGWPEAVMFSGMGLAIYAVIAGLYEWRRCRRLTALFAPLVCVIGAGAAAVLLSMAQILPQWELTKLSFKRSDIVNPMLDEGSVHPFALFTLLVPSLYGIPSYWLRYWGPTVFEYWVGAFYTGIVPVMVLCMVCVVFLVSGGRGVKTEAHGSNVIEAIRVPFLVTLLAFSFLYAMGKYTIFFLTLWETVPILQKFRWPSKILTSFDLSLCCLAGIGIDWLYNNPRLKEELPRWRAMLLRWGTLGLIIIIACFAAVCALNIGGIGVWIMKNIFNLKALQKYYAPIIPWGIIVKDCYKFVIIATVSACVLSAYVFGKRARTLFWWALFFIAVCDLAIVGYSILPSAKPLIFDNKRVFRELMPSEKNVSRFYNLRLLDRFLYGEESTKLYNLARGTLFGGWAQVNHSFNVEPHGNSILNDFYNYRTIIKDTAVPYEIRQNLFRMANCGTLVLPTLIESCYLDSRNVPIKFLNITDTLPRAYVVGRVVVLGDREDVFKVMAARQVDYSQVALMSQKDDGAEDFSDLLGGCKIEYRLDGIEYDYNKVSLKVYSAKRGVLIVSDTYYPGWVARINGVITSIYKVNGAFRGIRIPKGESTVIMEYRPKSFTIGVIISGITIVVLILLFIWFYRKRL